MAKMVVVMIMMIAAAAAAARSTQAARWRHGDGGGVAKDPEEEEEKMVFYMHDVPGGSDPTAVVVAGANQNSTSTAAAGGLGTTLVFDDKLTQGPETGWREIGRGQGMYSFATLNPHQDPALFMAFTAVFHSPERLNGSTLAFLGSDRVLQASRDLAIVGGTGVFRRARGVATLSTFSFNPPNAIIKFDLSMTILS